MHYFGLNICSDIGKVLQFYISKFNPQSDTSLNTRGLMLLVDTTQIVIEKVKKGPFIKYVDRILRIFDKFTIKLM